MTDAPEIPGAPAPRPWRNFHGRVHGKSLRQGHRALLEGDLEARRLSGVAWAENPARTPLDLAGPLWLEVGFGSGEHLMHVARANPGVTHLGAEPYVNGVATLLAKLAAEPLPNLRIHPGDARDLLDVLPAAGVTRAYLLYPDPWPKARHHKRRFVTPEPLAMLARAMAPGAELRIATDVPDYMRQAVEEVARAGFEVGEVTARPWAGWPSTRYEAKALREGRAPAYLIARRP